MPGDLGVAERLRTRWPAHLVAAATEQVELRARAAAKYGDTAGLLFTRDGLEQATASDVARHRARRFAGRDGLVLDLCCGIGGDLVELAAAAPSALTVGVDRDEAHAWIARHNARTRGAPATTVAADVRDVSIPRAAAVFVDPARRAGGHRGGYQPPLPWCFELPAAYVAVKAAPGIAHDDVPAGWEREFVAVGRDLKEAALWAPPWATARARATVLPGGHSLVAQPQTPPAAVRPPGRYVLDPSPAVTRAGAVADLAHVLDAWQIDPQIAFLCADVPLRTPFGRSLAVAASLPFRLREVAAELRRLDIGPLDIRRRGLAGDVDELRRRLRTPGRRHGVLLLTRMLDQPWALICFQDEGTA